MPEIKMLLPVGSVAYEADPVLLYAVICSAQSPENYLQRVSLLTTEHEKPLLEHWFSTMVTASWVAPSGVPVRLEQGMVFTNSGPLGLVLILAVEPLPFE